MLLTKTAVLLFRLWF